MNMLKNAVPFFFLVLTVLISSCDEGPETKSQQDILPESFSVDIPSSISNSNSIGGRIGNGKTKEDPISGNEVYEHLNTFIAVGEKSAELVEAIINGIRVHKIDRVKSLTYVSDDDNRTKNLVVSADATFENKTWDYMLTITDADSEGNVDGGKALQIFWNKKTEVEGVAIIKPYNCDRVKNSDAGEAIFRVDYTESSTLGYDAQMEVRIASLPLPSPLVEPYAMNNLKMFAGKKGDVVDVYGNSNHPNALIFEGEPGFNWAFIASGNNVNDIGVAKVGLPPSTLNSTDKAVLLDQYSIKNVFTNGITALWPQIDQLALNQYLQNTDGPGYFNNEGFISGGVSPGVEWDALSSRLTNLTPYNPAQVSSLSITFK